ncbi:hypothetical protein BSZ28_26340 [Pseudomonas moraviensis]|nr:hypothetical protein BSZ28_26340 [Pseudomonas moraviensis]
MFCHSSLPEPYPDEALSSWMYRVRETFPEPEIRALREMSGLERESSPFAAYYARVLDSRGKDLDFRFEHPEVVAFMNAYDLSAEWIKSVFSPVCAQIIPIWFRSDYCMQCMEESIADIGFPVYLKSWRLTLKPFCQKHRCVLYSTDNSLHHSMDFAMSIFEYGCARSHELERISKWLAKDSEVQALGWMVADRIDLLLSKIENTAVHNKLLSFIMTLLRVTLMRKNWGNYTSVIKFTVPSSKTLESVNDLPLFYQLPYCVTGMARARSFYLIGLLLGWIDEEQAENAKQRDDFYLATSASDIWRRVADMPRIRTLLQLFSTDLLGMSTLTGWEFFDV